MHGQSHYFRWYREDGPQSDGRKPGNAVRNSTLEFVLVRPERVHPLGSRQATSMRQPRVFRTSDVARGTGTTAALLQRSVSAAGGCQSPQAVGPVGQAVRPDRCRCELPPRAPPEVGTVASGVAPLGLSTDGRVDEARNDHPTWTLSTLPGWPITSSTAFRPDGTAHDVLPPREWSRSVTSSATRSQRGTPGLTPAGRCCAPPARGHIELLDYGLFTVRGERPSVIGVHAAVLAALVSRIRVR